jgi:hypothetical protein
MLMQVISIAGAVMVLIAYAAHQMERMRVETFAYQLLNLCGGAMLVAAAITTRQAGLILMEGAWVVISVYGLVKLMGKKI